MMKNKHFFLTAIMLLTSSSIFACSFGIVKVRNATSEDVYVKFYNSYDTWEWIPCTAQTIPANSTVEVPVNCASDNRTVKLDSKVCRVDAFRNQCYTLIKTKSGVCIWNLPTC